MKVNDEVYALLGWPGPDLHVFVVTAVHETTADVYDACCEKIGVISLRLEQLRPVTEAITALSFLFGPGTREPPGPYTVRQLLDAAHKWLTGLESNQRDPASEASRDTSNPPVNT